MPDYHLRWDMVETGYVIALAIPPESAISITGVLRLTIDGVRGPEQQLRYSDLAPRWSHTITEGESLHLTLTLCFHTSAVSMARLTATCKKPDGTLHQGPPYNETYCGQLEHTTDVFVWADR